MFVSTQREKEPCRLCSVPNVHPSPLPVQHYLTSFGAMTSIPLILSEGLCLLHDSLTQSRFINTSFFASGLITLLQVTFGVRSGLKVTPIGLFINFILFNYLLSARETSVVNFLLCADVTALNVEHSAVTSADSRGVCRIQRTRGGGAMAG